MKNDSFTSLGACVQLRVYSEKRVSKTLRPPPGELSLESAHLLNERSRVQTPADQNLGSLNN